MKKPTLSILTIAVIFAPLTAFAQKIQRKNPAAPSTDASIIDRASFQINHNAYGVPLNSWTDQQEQEAMSAQRHSIHWMRSLFQRLGAHSPGRVESKTRLPRPLSPAPFDKGR